jgi:hypothetical protein
MVPLTSYRRDHAPAGRAVTYRRGWIMIGVAAMVAAAAVLAAAAWLARRCAPRRAAPGTAHRPGHHPWRRRTGICRRRAAAATTFAAAVARPTARIRPGWRKVPQSKLRASPHTPVKGIAYRECTLRSIARGACGLAGFVILDCPPQEPRSGPDSPAGFLRVRAGAPPYSRARLGCPTRRAQWSIPTPC